MSQGQKDQGRTIPCNLVSHGYNTWVEYSLCIAKDLCYDSASLSHKLMDGSRKSMPCGSAGSTVAATAALAGEDAPALITVGKDGAVFYWMYDPAPPHAHPTPQGYAQVPGKHRKRKAPDTDPIQPKTAAANGGRADQGNKLSEAEDDEHDSSSNEDNTGGSEGGEAGATQAQAAVADPTDDAAEMLASTSGRIHGDQQQQEEQTMSFAGE